MNKKLIPLMIATSFASLFTVSALSAPVANLKISGDIKPPTCTVNGATQSNIIFDYGKISPSLIPQSEIYQYPDNLAQNTVTIECDASTYLTFSAMDTYSSSELDLGERNGSYWFHLVGSSNASKSVGATLFAWDNVTVDGKLAYISRSNDVAITGSSFTNVIYKGPTNGWTSEQQTGVDKNTLKLMPGKVFQTNFRQGKNNQTFIISKDQLNKNEIDITNGLDFIGEAVLTFNFGV